MLKVIEQNKEGFLAYQWGSHMMFNFYDHHHHHLFNQTLRTEPETCVLMLRSSVSLNLALLRENETRNNLCARGLVNG